MYINNALNNTAKEDFLVTTATAGTDRKLSVTNTDNTNAASHAHVQLTTGGASGGDPYIGLANGVVTAALGIDNSDSDKLKLTTGATPSAGTDLVTVTTAGAVSVLAGDLSVVRSSIGGDVKSLIENSDATNTSSNAWLHIKTYSGGGDCYVVTELSGAWDYTFGLSHADQTFRIGHSGPPTTCTPYFIITNAGEITEPLQPAFLAYRNNSVNTVTGAGTAYTIPYDTEVYDQNSDYNVSGTFTAPVTGRYTFSATVGLYNITSAMTSGIFKLIASNRTIVLYQLNPVGIYVGSDIIINGTTFMDMDAADTVYVTITFSNGASDAACLSGINAGLTRSAFSGSLIC